MADYSYGGADEENAELKKLNAEVVRLSVSRILGKEADSIIA